VTGSAFFPNQTSSTPTQPRDTPYPTNQKAATMSNNTSLTEGIAKIVSENGGTDAAWDLLEDPNDQPDGKTSIERWAFPRYKGAEKNGDVYVSRSGVGDNDTDVETIVSWLEAPRNVVGAILLLGNPGTGKTALIEAAVTHADREITTVVCTPDHTKDSLFLRFVGEGKGEAGTPFALGQVPYAVKHGHTLYLDEVLLLADGVKSILYSLADGRRFLPEGNVDGSALEIHPDFRVVFSSNPMVRGASLPEPLSSRCAGTTLTVETSASMLRDLGVSEDIVSAWDSLGHARLWRPEIREVRAADYWLRAGSTSQAISALVPEHCPDSQREEVSNLIASFIGGATQGGRLVIS
jgi:hypothetical protein